MKALITGIRGQDGSYLAELLRGKGYEVEGINRGDGDLTDRAFVDGFVKKNFDEIYNLASLSTVQHPWEDPVGAVKSTALIPLTMLDAIRAHSPTTRFFQASSSEMFGNPTESPQSETTPFNPQKPYAYGKLLAHQAIAGYRTYCGLFAVSGILYNHESPRRHERFVTRKITSSLAKIKRGEQESMTLGNLNALRDWGYAGDFVEAMHAMLTADAPDDYVIATGQARSVRDFVEAAAAALDMHIAWSGSGPEEVGTWEGRPIVAVSKEFYRPAESMPLIGDISKIKKSLGWEPKTSFKEMVREMVEAEGK